jgi:hypothetical protein
MTKEEHDSVYRENTQNAIRELFEQFEYSYDTFDRMELLLHPLNSLSLPQYFFYESRR